MPLTRVYWPAQLTALRNPTELRFTMDANNTDEPDAFLGFLDRVTLGLVRIRKDNKQPAFLTDTNEENLLASGFLMSVNDRSFLVSAKHILSHGLWAIEKRPPIGVLRDRAALLPLSGTALFPDDGADIAWVEMSDVPSHSDSSATTNDSELRSTAVQATVLLNRTSRTATSRATESILTEVDLCDHYRFCIENRLPKSLWNTSETPALAWNSNSQGLTKVTVSTKERAALRSSIRRELS